MVELFREQRHKLLVASALLIALSFAWAGHAYANDGDAARNGRLITIHDRGDERVILTKASFVDDALKQAGITIDPKDIVEPKRDSQLVAPSYVVNIYRARPVIVVDGVVRQKVMTAAQTPSGIIEGADIPKLHDEDKTAMTASGNITTDGASTVLTVDRAIPFTLQLYGKPSQTYSHAKTVGEMLKQKGVKLGRQDVVSTDQTTPLTAGMLVTIWRNGVQTATMEEQINFSTRKVLDADQPIGYHKTQTPGTNGRKSVTYEITAHAGRETGRKVIQSVTLEEPKEQIEVIGTKSGPNALTRSKGAQQYTDSKGVTHRETYYDLPMNIVMNACGGGNYTIRSDGAKIDKDGYILIAANLGNYPRCSIVETSMGLGKVYDTGGFAVKHPHGFDLATDWTNNDGR